MDGVKNLVVGCKVDIELESGERYRGTFVAHNAKYEFVDLAEVRDLVTGESLHGMQTYFKPEIVSIRAVTDGGAVGVVGSRNHHIGDSVESVQSPSRELEANPPRNGTSDTTTMSIATSLSDEELSEFSGKVDSAIYIWQCDATYHNALDDLRRQELIGFNIEDAKVGRLKSGSLLSFSTNDKVYLFDLQLFGKIFPEIKRILEAEKPRKIVHNSCFVVDQLKYCYKCQLAGIQDTMIMHFAIKQRKRPVSIGHCLTEYFGVDSKLSKSKIDWETRPLLDEMKIVAAFNVVYLIKMYVHMTGILLRPIGVLTEEYSKTYAKNDDTVEVFKQISNRKNPALRRIDVKSLNDSIYEIMNPQK